MDYSLSNCYITSCARPRKVAVIEEVSPQFQQSNLSLSAPISVATKPINESDSLNDPESIETPTSKYVVNTAYSKDQEAKWGYQGGFKYGYKSLTSVNTDGYVNGYFFTAANVNEVSCLKQIIEIVNPQGGTPFTADKGFDSKDNDDLLKTLGLINFIMKKQKNIKNPDPKIIERNRAISENRFVVERTFGTLKRCFMMGRSRYIGMKKTYHDWSLGCLVHNMVRAVNHLFDITKPRRKALIILN